MPSEKVDEKAVFRAAIALGTPAERIAYLDRVCGANPECKARIEALVRAYDSKDQLLDPLLSDTGISPENEALTEGSGTVVGRYKLLEKIGEGGMAVVYMAEQAEPIRRKVALKIIKLGMDTRQVIARFEAERQALAMMDHPNIAKVLDAGATDTGRPYFVMELVTGVSITEYCDQHSLSTKGRLALFIQVCHAVQHAHQKGIIHRDLKPSNVMVTQRDGLPLPKVIDFGIAKATNQRLTEKTLFTRYAHIIGTPAYMSPEQAELSDLDVDTRSDIYSLGVLLYELLTGTTPFSEEELRKAGYVEMQRVIREQEPAKPSTKLSTLGETLTEVATHRSSSPDVLRRAVRGDLDWIVMKSLEKDRTRRYETASALGTDVQRHLDSEAVLARGPGASYRLQKFLHRHRVQICVIIAFAAVAVAASIILAMWNRDRLQLVEAESFRDGGILSQARELYAKADRDAAVETIRPILESEYVGPEAQLLHAGVLVDNRRPEEAIAVLESLLNERPEIAGAAHSLLARVLWESPSTDAEKLSRVDEHRGRAEELLPKTAEAYFLRAMTATTIKEKFQLLDEALRRDPGHYESYRLRTLTYYASRKYEDMEDDAIAMITLRPRDSLGHSLRATARHQLGQYERAVADYDSAIALTTNDDPEYVDLNAQRCDTLMAMGQYDRAIADARQFLEVVADAVPLEFRIFCALTALGNYEEARSLFQRVTDSNPAARSKLRNWSRKYVFDRLQAGQRWHAPGSEPDGAAFLPMLDAQRTYRNLSAKAKRVVTDAFAGHWSPDGTKLAFSTGFYGYSGVAVLDAATGETNLLIVPGKDPAWSPDGRYLAFVRDCLALPVSELAGAERANRHRAPEDEEVWIMKADGTEPRRLASGRGPCWSRDPNHVYFYSEGDDALCEISIADSGSQQRPILKCADRWPKISPDGKYVACTEGHSLRVLELASGSLFAEWKFPAALQAKTWSPDGRKLCFGAGKFAEVSSGLWVHDLDTKQTRQVLAGPIRPRSLAPDGTKFAFGLTPPYFEIWVADLDPNAGIVDSLGPGLTLQEHLQERLALYTQRIEANPEDANNYYLRAQCHGYLGDRASANADMRRWSAVAGGGQPSDSQLMPPGKLRRVIDMPFDCQLVFSAERPVHTIPTMSVAFRQKGRCEMKLFEIPVVATSLLGICAVLGFEAPSARADFTFGEPVNLGPTVNSSALDGSPNISADGLELFFMSRRPGGLGWGDIWVAKRATKEDDWGNPENLGPTVNSSSWDLCPCVSSDGLTLYFASLRPGGYGGDDLYMATRATKEDDWSSPVNLGPVVNSSVYDFGQSISADGLELYFASHDRPGGHGELDLWVTTRETTNDDWGQPVNLGPTVNSSASEGYPSLSTDGLTLFFSDNPAAGTPRPGGYGGTDIWMTTRATRSDPWGQPVNAGPIINSPSNEDVPGISVDGSTLYFECTRSGGSGDSDLWQAPILPVVDFNGDGKASGRDVVILAEHWGQEAPLCDIGPTPLGDGVVDEEDLFALAEYLEREPEQPLVDPTLIAHWPLDETEGMLAFDCAGEHDGVVVGTPMWQPDVGKIGGAIQCDGVDDMIITTAVPSLQDGPFSIVLWIRGGAPGQVILAQQGSGNWLYLNEADGSLMAGLMGSGRNPVPLYSDVVITDDQWHRIGLVWDGAKRTLCVDGEEAASDEQERLIVSGNGLNIGCGRSLETGSFFTGLIDDVRIYSRTIKP